MRRFRLSRHQARLAGWIISLAVVTGAAGVAYWAGSHYDLPSGSLPSILSNHPQRVGGQLVSLTHTASLTPQQVDEQAKVVYNVPDLPHAQKGVEEYSMVYTSQDPRDGRQIQIKGRIYLPDDANNLPVFGFGPGTTGDGSICAASLERARGKDWGLFDNHLAYYAGQGFAVVTTDYDGRQSPSDIHHYFVGQTEGRAMLDMVRALRQFKDPSRFHNTPAGSSVFFSGYSEGGHAALWADQIRDQYAPDVDIKGIVGFAPATDVLRMFYDTAGGTVTNWIPPYVYAAYQDYYHLPYPASDFFKGKYAQNIESDARNICVDQAGGVIPGYWGVPSTIGDVYQPDFLASLKDHTFPQKYPVWADLMQQNLAGRPSSTPKLFVDGDRDIVIRPAAQADLMKRVCAGGANNAELVMDPKVSHYTAMQFGRTIDITWMHDILAGKPAPSNCGNYR